MMNYPNYYYPTDMQRQQYMQPIQNPDERIWVQGEAGANAYLVAANGFVRLWDSQSPTFYEKRADSSGRPSMDIYEYKKKGSQVPNTAGFFENTDNELLEQIKCLETRITKLEEGYSNAKNKSVADDAAV